MTTDVQTPDKLTKREEDLLAALGAVQHALACYRDGKHIVLDERIMTLEEVKYCIVDPAIEKAIGPPEPPNARHAGSKQPCP